MWCEKSDWKNSLITVAFERWKIGLEMLMGKSFSLCIHASYLLRVLAFVKIRVKSHPCLL